MNRDAIGWSLEVVVVVFFLVVAHGCDASLLSSKFRKLATVSGPKKNNFPPPEVMRTLHSSFPFVGFCFFLFGFGCVISYRSLFLDFSVAQSHFRCGFTCK